MGNMPPRLSSEVLLFVRWCQSISTSGTVDCTNGWWQQAGVRITQAVTGRWLLNSAVNWLQDSISEHRATVLLEMMQGLT